MTAGLPRNAGWELWHSPDAVGVCPPYRWTLENEVSKPSGRKGQDNGQQLPPTYAGLVVAGSGTAHSRHSPVRSWGGQGWCWAPHIIQGPSFCLEVLPASVRGLQCHNRKGKMGLAHGRFCTGLAWKGHVSLWHTFVYPSWRRESRKCNFPAHPEGRINGTENKSHCHMTLNFPS